MKDIARKAGVSQSSVSLILNKNENASFTEETIKKVFKAASELHYQIPYSMIRKKATRTIMVITVNISNPYYTMLIQSIEKEANAHDFSILIRNAYRSPEMEAACIENALELGVDGVILLSMPQNPENLNKLSGKIPVVLVCNSDNITPGYDSIEMQMRDSAMLICDHLFSLSHKSIALITTAPLENSGRRILLSSVTEQMEKHGYSQNLYIFSGEPSNTYIETYSSDYDTGYALMQNEGIYDLPITAFICTNDSVAYGVMDALYDRGYKIPHDYSVIGLDNYLYSNIRTVSLTTVDHRMTVKGKSAVELLVNKIELLTESNTIDPLSDLHTIEYKPHLIVRNSTGSAPQAQ